MRRGTHLTRKTHSLIKLTLVSSLHDPVELCFFPLNIYYSIKYSDLFRNLSSEPYIGLNLVFFKKLYF